MDKLIGNGCHITRRASLRFKKEKFGSKNLKKGWVDAQRQVGKGLTAASMRKKLYYYIPGGRLDDVYSILNVTYRGRAEGR